MLLLLMCATATLALPDNLLLPISSPPNGFTVHFQSLIASLQHWFLQPSAKDFGVREMVQIVALCSLLPGLWYLQKQRKGSKSSWSSAELLGKGAALEQEGIDANGPEVTDPGLLKKHSELKTFRTVHFTYPNLRVFFRRHPQADKLPTEPAALPLLVFIHGLGGSVAQFHPLLTSLVNLASCLSIDLPGCGMSEFGPKSWDAYTAENMAELLGIIIEQYREKDKNQGVVLIGHSMGCSLAALLASRTVHRPNSLSEHVVGLVAVCPRANAPNEEEAAMFRKLLWIPGPLFNMWRNWDKRGGIESNSVHRFVGADADEETKKLQYRFNDQSKTYTWRRMAAGILPHFEKGVASGGLPGKEVWAGLEVPVFLVAGAADNITKPGEIEKIAEFLGKSHPVQIELDKHSEPVIRNIAPIDSVGEWGERKERGQKTMNHSINTDLREVNPNTTDDASHEDPSTPNEELFVVPPQPARPKKVLKTTILPAPASHALLYQPATVRILAGLISDFLRTQVSPRLSLGWQLQFLSSSGKWDVKNLAKWQAVKPVSEPIAGVFRAMKTLREVDESHCPEVFVREWGCQIKDIVDISHESPVYDPHGLEKGGTHYHKFPTVSKIPPQGEEVTAFISLVDRLIEEQKVRAEKESWVGEYYVGVHCHYGFNRTGYFVVCYMVERLGYNVQKAIDEFAKNRPKGIKHAHFLDQLFVRYCKGLQRMPTL